MEDSLRSVPKSQDHSAAVQKTTTWAVATSTDKNSGRQMVCRYAESFVSTSDRGSQPDRIMILWRFQSETGQPTPEELEQMTLLEGSLEAFLEQEGLATLVLVATGENVREWTYYAASADAFVQGVNVALSPLPKFPIQIHTASDPTWSTYARFRMWVNGSAD